MENKISETNSYKTNRPTVSVCMITYGHEKYIEDAVNGVLMQECDFEIELILSNDCSPDNTDKVIQNILNNHPRAHIIKYFNQEKNLGMMPNSIFVLEKSQGYYIATCEGDDFWTDKFKLKKQIDFLKANKECSLCFHNATIHYEDTNQNKLFVSEYYKTFYSANDILQQWLIPSASMVFVNVLRENKLPDFFYRAVHGDLALQLFLFEFGNFGLINEDMCTYRINENSATQTFFNNLEYKYLYIHQLKKMKKYFNGEYNKYFNNSILVQSQNIIIYRGTGHLIEQLNILLRMCTLDIFNIKKTYVILWQSFKIFAHNVLDKTKTKSV